MTTIVTRSGKGSSLSWVEMDANLNNLNADKLEASALTPYATTAAVNAGLATKINTTEVGVSVQAYSANLDEYATVNPTAAGLALLDDADTAAQRATLGLGTAATATLGTSSGQVPTADQIPSLVASGHGHCRLIKSGANLVLQPFNGNKIIINGAVYSVPSAGVSLSAPATTNTTYYIYAYMNTGTMTLEASATGHATDSTTGVEIKSGDATRTLVGMARTVSSAWVDTATQRFVSSWFNRQRRPVLNSLGSNATGIGAAWVSLGSGGLVEWVGFDGRATLHANATALDPNAGTLGYLSISVDGSQQSLQGYALIGSSVTNQIIAHVDGDYAEGYHSAQLHGGGVNATYYAGYTGINGRV